MQSSSAVDRPPRPVRAASRTTHLSMEGAYDVAARVAAIRASGRRVANLSIGEPSFATPEHIVEAGTRALRDGATRYTPVAGIAPLRESIAQSLNARGIPARPDNVIVTPGAKPALFYALQALIEPGDEVLVPDPGFPAYASVVAFAGGVPVGYRTTAPSDDLIDEIGGRITPRTRLLVLNTPGNPVGTVLGAGDLERLAELVLQNDFMVLSDECYGRLVYDGSDGAASIASLAGLSERTVVVDSFSKTYAMTGWRLGFALAPSRLARTLARFAVNGHSCTPDFVQQAGVAALTGPQGPLARMRAELRGRRDVLIAALNTIPGISCVVPVGAFYAFADVSRLCARRGQSTTEFADWLLAELLVAGVPGAAFGPGGDGHIRLSFAAPTEDIALAIDRLRDALAPESCS